MPADMRRTVGSGQLEFIQKRRRFPPWQKPPSP
jgi:hypothetical protein